MQKQRPGVVLVVTSLAAFLAFLDVTIVNIAFPAVRADFADVSLAGLSWVFTAYNVVFAALLVPAGRLADARGHKRVFLAGLVLFGLSSLACALAPGAAVLVAARAVQALAAALLTPASLALVLAAFPPERRGFAVGTQGAMGGIAAAAGPALGGVLVETFGWRAVFLVNVPIVLITVVVGWFVLTESRPSHVRLPDPLGVLLLGGGVAVLSLGVVAAEGGGWLRPAVLVPLAVGVLALVLFFLRGRRVPNPLVEPALFRLRSFTGAVVGNLVFACAFYALLLSNILFLTSVWGYDTLTAGFAVTPGPLLAALASPLSGRLADRLGARTSVLLGALLFTAGCVLFLTRTGPDPAWLAVFLPATLLTGTGVGFVFAGLGAGAVAQLPPQRYGTGSAVATTARQIGAVLGIALLLSGLAAAGSDLAAFHTAWLWMALGGVATGVAGVVVGAARATTRLQQGPPAAIPVSTSEETR